MKAIYKRELHGFFLTGIGYVFIGVFITLAGMLFYINNLLTRSSDLSGFFNMVVYIWILLAPVLVMRLIAGDRKMGTDQLLLTAPVYISRIITAKYLASLTILAIALAISFVFPILIMIFGYVHLPEILTGYLGLFLCGGAYLAFDMFVSSFSHSPASAFILAFGANLLLRMSGLLSAAFNLPSRLDISRFFDLDARYLPFVFGQMSFANILFYMLFAAASLFVSVQMMKIGRWTQA